MLGRVSSGETVVPSADCSCRQCADLGEVVGEDAVSAPDPGAGEAVEHGAVPAGAPFEVGDATFAAGAPFDQGAEGSSVLGLAAGRSGLALAGNGDGAHTELMERGFDAGLAVAAVGGDCSGWPAAPAGDAGDGRGELRGVGRV